MLKQSDEIDNTVNILRLFLNEEYYSFDDFTNIII